MVTSKRTTFFLSNAHFSEKLRHGNMFQHVNKGKERAIQVLF